MKISLLAIVALLSCASVTAQTHQFSFDKQEFLLDGRPFQIISGEMHPARIPKEYWRHRIRMAKAMGCNTIAAYIFWNYHEASPGVFDFSSENRDIAAFIRICQEEKMWVLLRPGPYVCAEWDWGGLPFYLLKTPDIRIRCMDPRYIEAVQRYVTRLSKEVVSLQCDKGGPILMVQVENEYGSYANDRTYIQALKKMWVDNGITVPFYTADGPTDFMLDAGSLDGCAIGLDSGGSDKDFDVAAKHNPNVPAFSSESYPGWLTHWKEPWQRPDTAAILKEVRYLLGHKRSFNLYVVHGGTNFGYGAGANAFNPTQFQPDVTSYDYDAPITEQGLPTPKYYALRDAIFKYLKQKPIAIPAPIPAMTIPAFTMSPVASIFDQLPTAIHSVHPLPMEMLDQHQGMMLYRTKLIGHKSGQLTITEPHDYALIYLNGKFIDTIFRDGGKWTITLPKTDVKDPVLDILVEGMGHINFAQYMIDRKGITDRVTLNGMTLMDWEMYKLPMDAPPASSSGTLASTDATRPGYYFKGSFRIEEIADTYLDLSHFQKGVIWVNGHNLGRYWNTGPQFRFYCPASWLKKGDNEVVIFDLHHLKPETISGEKTLTP